ncbi:MAG: hypothetical protein ACOCVM_01365 [Desulfovibrionaceae bacterium]
MKRAMIFAAGLLALLLAAPAMAGSGAGMGLPRVEGYRLRATPRLTLRAMYDDNVDMKEIADKELAARPGMKLEAWDEKTRIEASGDVVLRDYLDHDDLDRLDYFWDAMAERRLSERFDLKVEADQTRDHMVDSVSEDFGFDVEPSVRTITTISPSADWSVTERAEARLGYEWVKANYDRDRYSDFTTHQADLELSYALDERTSVLGRAVGQHTGFKRGSPSMEGSQWAGEGFMGLSRQLTESIGLRVLGGRRGVQLRVPNQRRSGRGLPGDCLAGRRGS